MTPSDDLRKKAVHGFVWAAAQSWGGKILTFMLFVVLARLLSPADFGVAAAVFLILTALAIVTEFGFSDAIIQRPELNDQDINIPFFVSMVLSGLVAVLLVWGASQIEIWMNVPGLAPVIRASALIVPLNTAALFQEALYRRHMMFKSLALRLLLGTVVGGIAACVAAFMGWGVFALIVQAYVTSIVNAIWLWSKPIWKPTFNFAPASFMSMARFSIPVFGVRVLDFAVVRTADFIVLSLYGVVVLGLYTAGIKLLQVVLLLFQSVLSDVALTFLAKIADDRPRVSTLYIKTTTLSVALLAPMLVMMAALAPEISDVMFGQKWVGIDQMMRPFLLLGAVQCVQYLNGAYYNALGRPMYSFVLQFIKIAALIPVFLCSLNQDVFTFVQFFCIAQAVVAVPSFFFITRMLDVRMMDIAKEFLPFIMASLIGYAAVLYAHDGVTEYIHASFLRGMALGAVFCSVYVACVWMIAKRQAIAIVEFLNMLKSLGVTR